MCLLVLAWNVHPRYRLIVAANRDEFHERPAAALAKWPPPQDLIAGRDLRAGGTWLAANRQRRFGVVTNFRDLQSARAGASSRGELIPAYLNQSAHARVFLEALEASAAHYSGFNLLLTDDEALWYATNRAAPFARALPPGVYGLANQLLDTPWPKLLRVRRRFEAWLQIEAPEPAADLFAMLNDREPEAGDITDRDDGLPVALARALSAPFVQHPNFGTRCSTVLLLEPSGAMALAERRFDAHGEASGETAFALKPGEWP